MSQILLSLRKGMLPSNWNKGFRAFVVTIIFLAIGIGSLWLIKTWLNVQQDAVLIALLLVPVFAYLILSDKLLEFSAGGVSAKFNATAQNPFFNKDEMKVEKIEIVPANPQEKGGLQELEQMLENPNSSGYHVLTVTLGKENYYTNNALLAYLRALSRYQSFKFLVVLDKDGKVFAYISNWRAIQIIEYEIPPSEQAHVGFSIDINGFATAINTGNQSRLLDYYGLVKGDSGKTTLTIDTSLEEALKKMTENKMDTVLVTDENDKLKGVVDREQLLSKLILSATK